MSNYRIALLVAIVAALIFGRAKPITWIVMLSNFAASTLTLDNSQSVALTDLTAATILAVFGNTRDVALALIFVVMALSEWIAFKLNIDRAMIYLWTEFLAYVQCGVIGGLDRGIGRLLRVRRRHNPVFHVYRGAEVWHHAQVDMARGMEQDSR